jgi:hypothetical protein
MVNGGRGSHQIECEEDERKMGSIAVVNNGRG